MTEPRKRIQVTFDVGTVSQAAELNTVWLEIVAGQRPRLNTAAEDTNEIMERARTALQRIVKAVERHPGTGQARRLVRFLAGVYNGNDYPFDLTDLRSLDAELANACIDYLNYDRLAKAEVHTHLPGGGKLCGATDGPWTPRGFDFQRVTCYQCQSLVLHPEDSPG
jgi:hypothetical protein